MKSRTFQVVLAFGVVYVVWGSTYLAIRIGVASLPPALFAGTRFLIAGAIMLAYGALRGGSLPKAPVEWRNTAIVGTLMLVGGNGFVTWAEQWVPSNQAALIIATSALWLAGLGSIGPSADRLNRMTLAGLLLGFGGVAVLVSSGLQLKAAPVSAYAGLLAAPICWSAGSIWSRRFPVPATPIITAGLQMVVAGLVLSTLGLALGEASRWQWSAGSLLVLAYLVVFGSCVAYGAYTWLVHEVTPARLGTYAYVNPAVAVVLGWWVLDETLNRAQVIGTVVILAGVVIVTLAARQKRAH